VDNGNVSDGDALGHGKEDVATGLARTGHPSVCGGAGACGKARKAAECGGDACSVHSTAQNRFHSCI
jgi:hypothetical protein